MLLPLRRRSLGGALAAALLRTLAFRHTLSSYLPVTRISISPSLQYGLWRCVPCVTNKAVFMDRKGVNSYPNQSRDLYKQILLKISFYIYLACNSLVKTEARP